MNNWTQLQLEILTEWINEAKITIKKVKAASQFYHALYYIMYIPFTILNVILIKSGKSEADTSQLATALLILSAFDRTFNFSSKSVEYSSIATKYETFKNNILEEMAKPARDRRNGTIFLHDTNTEKRRIDEQSLDVPWIIERWFLKKGAYSGGSGGATSASTTSSGGTQKSLEVSKDTAARILQYAYIKHLYTLPTRTGIQEKMVEKYRPRFGLPPLSQNIRTQPSLQRKYEYMRFNSNFNKVQECDILQRFAKL